ncbi:MULTISPECIES: ABC transporter permease [unclassified Corynebacterium]|uniref:ABC transporter permease n=1 Tax=unclassified Corynebacterium TaxID=2624378 RepID=UPI0029CA3AB9|nr:MULTISPECIES: ABC transporter permease subunit [unclassified Corynebacterium]WPF65879.1 ABC transporter permease subunit [Corynebacterium sp. 22KM0430]WPF68372.1 ABC transporter permease subunit [Corynebacterium sp. 21KM1197]
MTWLSNNWIDVLGLAATHLALCLPALFLSLFIALPLGRLAFTRPRLGRPLLNTAALLYTIPALPLLIIIPLIVGLPLRSPLTMILALTVYGVALLVRSVADGFSSVDQRVREGAIATGFSRRSLLWQVDLPLSAPVILAGLRVVASSTMGLVTIGALVGIPSLGTLITDGFQRNITAEVLTGVFVTVFLALLIDVTLQFLGRLLTPWKAPT